jgi:Tol biopolymer transport system component
MRSHKMRFSWLLALQLLALALITLSCGRGRSVSQAQSATAVAGTPLPVSQEDPVDVYAMNVDGQPRLLATVSSVPRFSWAPDDDHAALVTDITSRSGRIHVISVKDGTDIVAIDVAGNPTKFAWSPNGDWLAWESASQYDTTLEAMRVDGSDRQELASDSNSWPEQGVVFGWKDDDTLLATVWEQPNSILYEFDLASGTKHEVATQPQASWAEVSRDASRVIFVATGEQQGCSLRGYLYSLWTMDVLDGSLHQVLPDTCQLNSASWSPDGSQIAYGVGASDDTRGTYILDLASGASRKLSSSSTFFDHPQGWSSDGNMILVYRNQCPTQWDCPGPSSELVLVSVRNGDETVISINPSYLLSQDGGYLAFDKSGLQLLQLASGTAQQAMAADPDWRFTLLGWSPDGQWFAFARSRVNSSAGSPTP